MSAPCLGSLPVMRHFDHKKKTWLLYRIRCRMWNCEFCATINKYAWQNRIRDGMLWYRALGVHYWQMLTITSHEKNTTFETTAGVWPDAWKKLSMRMRRRWPMRYCLLPEKHEDGRLHVHALVGHPTYSYRLTTRWLKDHAPHCGLGYHAKVKPVKDIDKSVYYVTKYLTKAMAELQWPKRFRRIRVNNRWPTFQWEEDGTDRVWIYADSLETFEMMDYADKLKAATGWDVVMI